MSKANSATKVLRTAIKRVDKAWIRGSWSKKQPDGQYGVCLEGAIFGWCNQAQSKTQEEAFKAVKTVVVERYQDALESGFSDKLTVSDGCVHWVNDYVVKDVDEVKEILKLAIIKIETNYEEDETINSFY